MQSKKQLKANIKAKKNIMKMAPIFTHQPPSFMLPAKKNQKKMEISPLNKLYVVAHNHEN